MYFCFIQEKYIYETFIVKIHSISNYFLNLKRENDEKIPPAALDRG